jgi:hypothetical protein
MSGLRKKSEAPIGPNMKHQHSMRTDKWLPRRAPPSSTQGPNWTSKTARPPPPVVFALLKGTEELAIEIKKAIKEAIKEAMEWVLEGIDTGNQIPPCFLHSDQNFRLMLLVVSECFLNLTKLKTVL